MSAERTYRQAEEGEQILEIPFASLLPETRQRLAQACRHDEAIFRWSPWRLGTPRRWLAIGAIFVLLLAPLIAARKSTCAPSATRCVGWLLLVRPERAPGGNDASEGSVAFGPPLFPPFAGALGGSPRDEAVHVSRPSCAPRRRAPVTPEQADLVPATGPGLLVPCLPRGQVSSFRGPPERERLSGSPGSPLVRCSSRGDPPRAPAKGGNKGGPKATPPSLASFPLAPIHGNSIGLYPAVHDRPCTS